MGPISRGRVWAIRYPDHERRKQYSCGAKLERNLFWTIGTRIQRQKQIDSLAVYCAVCPAVQQMQSHFLFVSVTTLSSDLQYRMRYGFYIKPRTVRDNLLRRTCKDLLGFPTPIQLHCFSRLFLSYKYSMHFGKMFSAADDFFGGTPSL